MAIRFVFHWGPDSDKDRQLHVEETFPIWPSFGHLESKKSHGDACYADYRTTIYRDIASYAELSAVSQLSLKRLDDPEAELEFTYIPHDVRVINFWTKDGVELPWEMSAKYKSKVWKRTPPEFLQGIPYTTMYHGPGPEPPLKERRKAFENTQYQAKYFKRGGAGPPPE
jgi:hypothetical protein